MSRFSRRRFAGLHPQIATHTVCTFSENGLLGRWPAETVGEFSGKSGRDFIANVRYNGGMEHTISDLISAHPSLSRATKWDANDATLSGSERALAAIVSALSADFDALDGAQQRALADVLARQAEDTERAEADARKILGL